MSTTAELRSMTEELARQLAGTPHSEAAQRIAAIACAMSDKLEAADLMLNHGVGPMLAAVCVHPAGPPRSNASPQPHG